MTLLVSLAALRTFVEVARLRSFKDAAESLGVTSGAVSQQIKSVEQRLDVILFERTSRNEKLTEQGIRLLSAVSRPFEQIHEALEDFNCRRPPRKVVRMITRQALASHWLVPRIDSFLRRHPDIEVRIETADSNALQREKFDVAIRYETDDLHGFDIVKLATSKLLVVGSPRLLKLGMPIRQCVDCLAFPLLQDRDRLNWPAWFRASGITSVPSGARVGASFANDSLLIAAASASQGLALVRDIHAESLLLNGQLKVASATSIEPVHAYYLITPRRITERPHIVAFRDWLIAEFSKPRFIAEELARFDTDDPLAS